MSQISLQPPFATNSPGFYQLGYITNDLEGAITQFKESMGLNSVARYLDFPAATAAGTQMVTSIALAFLGGIQIEIIQPVRGDIGLYGDILEQSEITVRFHHVCKLFDTEAGYDKEMARLRAKGIAFPLVLAPTPDLGRTRMCFGDFRSSLGHYVEFAYLDEPAMDWIASVPHNDI